MADCPWCGEFMYEGQRVDQYDTCGARDCDRESRDADAADRDERRYKAEQDDFERY